MTIKRLGDIKLWKYAIGAATRRLSESVECPCCGSTLSTVMDRKLFHTLHKCSLCRILFRFPGEPAEKMDDFYEVDYAEPGLTTELPTTEDVAELKRNCFRDSEKDFSYHISILRGLGLKPGSYILDYGANWGYLVYQLQRAGYQAEGYEISKRRARFGHHLGVGILTEISQIQNDYDAVYSCHVLEHVPNPLAILRQQLGWLKRGGLVIAHTPNGSEAWRRANYRGFHLSWGRVHPVLLTDEFIRRNFNDIPYYVSTTDRPETVRQWNQSQRLIGDTSDAGLFFVLAKPA
jgi:SAM-dependent methyltransferase